MAQLSRRAFLRLLAAGAGALSVEQFLAACGVKPTSVLPPATQRPLSPTETAGESSPVTAPPEDTAAAPAQTPTGVPDLSVARGADPETIVRRALAAFGGMEKFVPQGARVVIKPNICVAYHTYEYAATTNPWVVGWEVQGRPLGLRPSTFMGSCAPSLGTTS